MTGGTGASAGRERFRALDTLMVKRPVREMGASGTGFEGVGVVDLEDEPSGVELRELPPDDEPSSLISAQIQHCQCHPRMLNSL